MLLATMTMLFAISPATIPLTVSPETVLKLPGIVSMAKLVKLETTLLVSLTKLHRSSELPLAKLLVLPLPAQRVILRNLSDATGVTASTFKDCYW